ncbi:MAG: DNA polymerase III subunit delta [Oscillospiraceae bacterium]
MTDLDPESLDNQQLKDMIKLVEELPETTVIVFALITTALDDAKPKAKTKKLVETVEKRGAVCKFPLLSVNAVAGMAARKAAKAGCTLSAQDAAFLAERCGCSLTLLQTEVEKLCTYRQSGEITRADISALVPRTLDASAYDLSELLFAGNCGAALRMLDDLFQQHAACAYPFGGVRGVRGLLPREARGQGREKLSAGGSGFRLLRRQSLLFREGLHEGAGAVRWIPQRLHGGAFPHQPADELLQDRQPAAA